MRLIDADAIKIPSTSVDMFENCRNCNLLDEFQVREIIDSAPSIDICFCKECRYCKKKRGTFKGEPIIFYRCEEHNRDVEADDFCSWGERSSE